jgi:regulator of sigma E protease
MNIILSLLVGLGVLGFLVLIHEAGHFFAARAAGVKVLEFGIGFPFLGRIFKFKRGETTYSVNWLLFGGFVQLYGEDAGSGKGPHSFSSKNVWVRFFIAIAGILVNIGLAVILFTILLATSGFKIDFQSPVPNNFPFGSVNQFVLIGNVASDSPAELAGMERGDKILAVDGNKVNGVTQVQEYVQLNKGKPITFTLQNINENSPSDIVAIPRIDPPEGQGALGIGLDEGQTLSYESVPEKVFVGVLHSVNMIDFQLAGLTSFLSQSVEQKSIEPIASQASGPVRIVAVLGVLVQNSGDQLLKVILTFTALISLMLGIGNLLPIPALDGGRLFFFLIEGVTGKKVKPKIENMIHAIGFAVLLFLMVLIVFNDFYRIFTGQLFG